jgi:hypothetical protein
MKAAPIMAPGNAQESKERFLELWRAAGAPIRGQIGRRKDGGSRLLDPQTRVERPKKRNSVSAEFIQNRAFRGNGCLEIGFSPKIR